MTFFNSKIHVVADLAHKTAKYAFNSPDFAYSHSCGLCRGEVVHTLTQHNCLMGRL